MLNINKKEASKVEKVTSAEAAVCAEQEKEAIALANYCQTELDKVLPILANAKKALSKLTGKDITTIKSYGKKAPPSIQLTLQAICVIMGTKPIVTTVNMEK